MQQELQQQVLETCSALETAGRQFTYEQWNTVPFKGSWTAGEVMDHILRSAGGLPATMNGPVTNDAADPSGKNGILDSIFLDFTKKFDSPEFIIPSPAPHNFQEQLTVMHTLKSQLLQCVTLPPAEVPVNGEIPGLGKLTRQEWMHFFIVHTQRHIRQIRNILATFKTA